MLIKLKSILSESDKNKKETWKPISGYEGFYEISSTGRVKRLAGESPFKRNGYKNTTISHDEIILKPRKTKKGYLECELISYKNSERTVKKYYVHRLVANEFLQKPKKDQDQINHKNGITNDNRVENLEWVDNDQNQQHAKNMRNSNN